MKTELLLEENKTEAGLDYRIRQDILNHTKDFKTSWIELGQKLFAVWEDKLYKKWGFEKFEDYSLKELGIKKQLSYKLLKAYFFIEQEEPKYLRTGYREEREAKKVPGYDEVNFLRLAKQNKDLPKTDYERLKNAILEKGQDLDHARKDLTAIIKERKQVDPEEERSNRNKIAIQRLLNSLRVFQREMEALKIVPAALIREASVLKKKLTEEIADE